MRKLLLVATLSFAAFAGCSKSGTADKSAAEKADKAAQVAAGEEDNLPSMTVDEVDAAITAKQAVAVDCNPDNARKKTGVLPGAILVTDDENYAASELPPDKALKLVFYCANAG